MKPRTKKARTIESDIAGMAMYDIRHYGAQGAPFDDTAAYNKVIRTALADHKGGIIYIPRHLANPSAFQGITPAERDEWTDATVVLLRERIAKLEANFTKLVKFTRRVENKETWKQERLAKLYGMWCPKADDWVKDEADGKPLTMTGEHRKWLKKTAEELSTPENPIIMKEYKK